MVGNYAEVACAVIEQAVRDYKMPVRTTQDAICKADARSFLKTHRLEDHIRMFHLNIDPRYLRRKLGIN
jgi:hypothetical protein